MVPTLDECEHIAALIARILPNAEDATPNGFTPTEVIIADGGSTDGTIEIVGELARGDPRIRLIHNPQRWQSAGVNQAVRTANVSCDVIVRMDAHAEYPEDFVARVAYALLETGADSVVVRLRTVGQTCFQRAVAAVANSRMGSGNSVHRVGGVSGFVDHGHHAGFRRSFFEDTGGYDEKFQANEDAELDARARAMGKRIWFAGDIELGYVPRRNPVRLAQQYFRYGVGRARTRRKIGETLRVRQLAPILLTLGIGLSLVGSIVAPALLWLPAAYVMALIIVGAILAARSRSACVLMAPVVLSTTQISWGVGFLKESLRGGGDGQR